MREAGVDFPAWHWTRRVICACEACGDVGFVDYEGNPARCPKCGVWTEDERSRVFALAAHEQRRGQTPVLWLSDLDEDQRAWFDMARRAHPQASDVEILRWLEGVGYDPRKDAAFLAEAEELLRLEGREKGAAYVAGLLAARS